MEFNNARNVITHVEHVKIHQPIVHNVQQAHLEFSIQLHLLAFVLSGIMMLVVQLVFNVQLHARDVVVL